MCKVIWIYVNTHGRYLSMLVNVVHFGSSNLKCNYSMNDTNLDGVDNEKDLGVVVSSNLKPSKQCASAVSRTIARYHIMLC